jgi:MYXO-CTERM domain-containing protein
MLTEFENVDGATGTTADAEWGQIVQCVTEVYSPYAVTVTDQRPADGSSYHEAIVAGNPQELAGLSGSVSGQVKSILGVAPLSSDCAAIDNVISFTFADNHGKADRVNNICWTASQESAHAFGLDHEYSFSDGASACNDPMTYRTDCGGEKFFRNESANCGETTNRACKCGGTQNSHLKILQVFGQGSPITGNPTLTMLDPAASGGVLGAGVALQAGAKRGVARVELYLNGYKWTQVDGARFGLAGQPDPSGYNIPVPKEVPDSIVDVKTIAYDDLGSSTESPVVTVTRGAACTSAASCATGQKCEAGKCFWDPPSGEVGDDCTYAQFCKSGLCTGTADRQICTQSCIPGVSDSCPSGLDCIMQTANAGVCFDGSTGGGCCAVDRGGGAWWAHAGVAALVLGLVTRRRRRR